MRRSTGHCTSENMEEDMMEGDTDDPDQQKEQVIRKLMAEGYKRSLIEYVIDEHGMEDFDQCELQFYAYTSILARQFYQTINVLF